MGEPGALHLYRELRERGLRPALLESLGSRTAFSRRTVLGYDPVRRLEVWDGRLYEDGREAGAAQDILARLELRARTGFFPAWIGFFTYEFARHLELPTNAPMAGLPEAAFYLYPDGYLWEDGRLAHQPDGAASKDDVAASEDAAAAEADPADLPLPTIELRSDYPHDEFVAGVEDVQERIREGWVYQVNLSHRFSFAARGLDPLAYYGRLRRANPSPFMGLVEGGASSAGVGDGPAGHWAVVSGSPERLFSFRDGTLTARPIAGTRPRGRDAGEDAALEVELRGNVKEQAEHVMLVDLLRNDLSRVCAAGSVEVSEAFTVERYSHVMHLVSEVRGRSDAHLADMVRAIFPGGTITGAPKESVMTEIARLEPVPRGPYTGSLGYVSGHGSDFNILIRSLTLAAGTGYISAGGGIVIGSDPPAEYMETRHKAEALLHVLGKGVRGSEPAAPMRDYAWAPPRPRRRRTAQVLFVECHDSFSFNIVNYLRMLGAEVEVVDHREAPRPGDGAGAALAATTHLVLGPGPGDPHTSGKALDWVGAALARGLPFLGVCLGHQALGVHLGARLERAPRPVHGEAHAVRHTGRGLFAGLGSPVLCTRYHSLCLTDLPSELAVDAWTDDGVVMAVSHVSRPAWGVQFHPESMLSEAGLELLGAFLAQRS